MVILEALISTIKRMISKKEIGQTVFNPLLKFQIKFMWLLPRIMATKSFKKIRRRSSQKRSQFRSLTTSLSTPWKKARLKKTNESKCKEELPKFTEKARIKNWRDYRLMPIKTNPVCSINRPNLGNRWEVSLSWMNPQAFRTWGCLSSLRFLSRKRKSKSWDQYLSRIMVSL